MTTPEDTPSEESKPCPHCGQGIEAAQVLSWAGQINAARRKQKRGGFADPDRARAASRAYWKKKKG